jgi:hypothetical protein
MVFTRAGLKVVLTRADLKVGPYMCVVLALLVGAGLQARPEAQERQLDVSRLPVNLERIERELRQTTSREELDGLNIRYIIEVYGQAPPLIFFTKEDNLLSGPVPHGAPTHKEILEHITPKEYRAPAADFSALMRWLAERAKK